MFVLGVGVFDPAAAMTTTRVLLLLMEEERPPPNPAHPSPARINHPLIRRLLAAASFRLAGKATSSGSPCLAGGHRPGRRWLTQGFVVGRQDGRAPPPKRRPQSNQTLARDGSKSRPTCKAIGRSGPSRIRDCQQGKARASMHACSRKASGGSHRRGMMTEDDPPAALVFLLASWANKSLCMCWRPRSSRIWGHSFTPGLDQ